MFLSFHLSNVTSNTDPQKLSELTAANINSSQKVEKSENPPSREQELIIFLLFVDSGQSLWWDSVPCPAHNSHLLLPTGLSLPRPSRTISPNKTF